VALDGNIASFDPGLPIAAFPVASTSRPDGGTMPTFRYVTLDVFTKERFGGNPLAVFPDATGIETADMQRIAAEFNYSEITFVLPPDDPANTARVRIFEPNHELPFAGHPNVGTAFLLGQMGSLFGRPVGDTLRFEELGGIVTAQLLRDGSKVTGARIRAPQPLQVHTEIEPETIAACASLAASDIVTTHHRPVMASVGLPFALAELRSVEALGRVQPDAAAFRTADARHRQPEVSFSLMLYARTGNSPATLRTRMFALLSNVIEDPATGSASAALGGYLTKLMPQPDAEAHFTLHQGVEMGRPSVIEVHAAKTAGEVRQVEVGGPCIPVMRGEIEL
jgi:trans-2,3-dihydro-3-hydroxyanthranilate isomerase